MVLPLVAILILDARPYRMAILGGLFHYRGNLSASDDSINKNDSYVSTLISESD
jgi:hypothetical protein